MFLHTFIRLYVTLTYIYFSKHLHFSPNRFENLGILRYVYLKFRVNFPNSTDNRKLRVLVNIVIFKKSETNSHNYPSAFYGQPRMSSKMTKKYLSIFNLGNMGHICKIWEKDGRISATHFFYLL